MSIDSLPALQTTIQSTFPANKGEEGASRKSSRIGKLLNGFRRNLRILWEKQIVEGVLLRRQIEKMYLILGGHIYFQTLSAAVRFDLFDIIKRHGPLSCLEIAGHLGVDEKPARILLLGCTSLGLVKKRGTKYVNSPLAQRLLTRDAPGNLVPIILWQHHINYRPMFHFHEAIKAGTNVGLEEFAGDEGTLYERLTHCPDLEQVFQDAMEAISHQANRMLGQFVDLSDVSHLLDVGGGNGANVIQLAERYPHLRATVFDSASVCHIARENISVHGLQDRVDAVAGNCFEGAFPAGVDCILFCHFFTIWSEEQNQSLLDKSYEALPVGGKTIIFNMMQRNDEKGPLSAALGSPYFLTLATGQGMLYTWNEYMTWMRRAGFRHVSKLELMRDHGAVIGTK